MSPSRKRQQADTERPSEAFRRQLRATRLAKGWTQEQLAEELEKRGVAADQAIVAKTEKPAGGRGISLDDAIAYAAVLGVAPINLIVPREDDRDFDVAPGWPVGSNDARAWVIGQRPLPGQDQRFYLEQVSEEEWRLGRIEGGIHQRMLFRYLVEAMARSQRALEAGDKEEARRQHRAAKRHLKGMQRELERLGDQLEDMAEEVAED